MSSVLGQKTHTVVFVSQTQVLGGLGKHFSYLSQDVSNCAEIASVVLNST